MELSIIIVNWNTRELLAQCLDSIYANPPNCEFETWVVDNASSDDGAQMVREKFAAPALRLIENRENVGFARANNQAIQASAGTHLLFLNSDTLVTRGAISRLLDFTHAHPRVGVLGASVLNRDETPQQGYSRFPTFWSETFFAFGLDAHVQVSTRSEQGAAQDWVGCDCISGAAFMVPRAVLDAVGCFDENFFMYSEEIDLQFRIKHAGWDNGVLRSAPIVHFGSASTRQSAAAMKAELFRSKVYFFRKHRSRVAAFVLHWVFEASILGRILRYHLLRDQSRKDLWMQAWKYGHARERLDQTVRHPNRDSSPVPTQPAL